MTNGKLIQITHEWSETKDGYHDENRDVWWAVTEPVGQFRWAKAGKPLPEEWDMDFGPKTAILGGQPVYIHSKQDVIGLRKLLDEIEKEFDK